VEVFELLRAGCGELKSAEAALLQLQDLTAWQPASGVHVVNNTMLLL
jgi:hypothetical protein